MKYTKILYMSPRDYLVGTIEDLSESGHIVTAVTPLREMREPNMDGVVITDWLIVYYPAELLQERPVLGMVQTK